MHLRKAGIILVLILLSIGFYGSRWHAVTQKSDSFTFTGEIRYLPLGIKSGQLISQRANISGIRGVPQISLVDKVRFLVNPKSRKDIVFGTMWEYDSLVATSYTWANLHNGTLQYSVGSNFDTILISGKSPLFDGQLVEVLAHVSKNRANLDSLLVVIGGVKSKNKFSLRKKGSWYSCSAEVENMQVDTLFPGAVTGVITWESSASNNSLWKNADVDVVVDSVDLYRVSKAMPLLDSLKAMGIELDLHNLNIEAKLYAAHSDSIRIDTVVVKSYAGSTAINGVVKRSDFSGDITLEGEFYKSAYDKLPKTITFFLVPFRNNKGWYRIRVYGDIEDYTVELAPQMLEKSFSSFDGALF